MIHSKVLYPIGDTYIPNKKYVDEKVQDLNTARYALSYAGSGCTHPKPYMMYNKCLICGNEVEGVTRINKVNKQ